MAIGDGADQRWYSLAEVSQALAEATQDLQAVLDLVARCAVELIGDGCAVLLASEDEGGPLTATEPPPPSGSRPPPTR
jgi:hypothetical protein